MARLKPNLNVIQMSGFAIGFTYLGAFSLANYWGMTTKEVTSEYPIQFYVAMAIMITLFLQEEIRDQKDARKEMEKQQSKETDSKSKKEEEMTVVQSKEVKPKKKKRRKRRTKNGNRK